MKVEVLGASNVPPEILSIWRTQVGAELLPVQVRAVTEFGLFTSASRAADAPDPLEDACTLVIDPGSRRVTYRGTPILTTPPHHLQRQALVALAGLAARAGEVVTMTEL